MRSPMEHIAKHAALGEQLVALVRDSGLLRKKPGRKVRAKAKAKPKAKKTEAHPLKKVAVAE